MSQSSIEMFTPRARGQCPMLAAGGEREACVSCQDPWDENNFEMRSYNVYNIIQHVTSSLVVTTRHEIFSSDPPISIRIILFSQFSGKNNEFSQGKLKLPSQYNTNLYICWWPRSSCLFSARCPSLSVIQMVNFRVLILTFHNWRLLIGECLRMLWQLR